MFMIPDDWMLDEEFDMQREQWQRERYEAEERAAWQQEQDDAEAAFYRLINEGRCIRCESPHTHDATGAYDACESRRCEECGYRYVTEL